MGQQSLLPNPRIVRCNGHRQSCSQALPGDHGHTTSVEKPLAVQLLQVGRPQKV